MKQSEYLGLMICFLAAGFIIIILGICSLFGFKMTTILNIFELCLAIMFIVMLVTGAIGAIYNRKILREYD